MKPALFPDLLRMGDALPLQPLKDRGIVLAIAIVVHDARIGQKVFFFVKELNLEGMRNGIKRALALEVPRIAGRDVLHDGTLWFVFDDGIFIILHAERGPPGHGDDVQHFKDGPVIGEHEIKGPAGGRAGVGPSLEACGIEPRERQRRVLPVAAHQIGIAPGRIRGWLDRPRAAIVDGHVRLRETIQFIHHPIQLFRGFNADRNQRPVLGQNGRRIFKRAQSRPGEDIGNIGGRLVGVHAHNAHIILPPRHGPVFIPAEHAWRAGLDKNALLANPPPTPHRIIIGREGRPIDAQQIKRRGLGIGHLIGARIKFRHAGNPLKGQDVPLKQMLIGIRHINLHRICLLSANHRAGFRIAARHIDPVGRARGRILHAQIDDFRPEIAHAIVPAKTAQGGDVEGNFIGFQRGRLQKPAAGVREDDREGQLDHIARIEGERQIRGGPLPHLILHLAEVVDAGLADANIRERERAIAHLEHHAQILIAPGHLREGHGRNERVGAHLAKDFGYHRIRLKPVPGAADGKRGRPATGVQRLGQRRDQPQHPGRDQGGACQSQVP